MEKFVSDNGIRVFDFSPRVLITDILLRWLSFLFFRIRVAAGESPSVLELTFFLLAQLLIAAFTTGYLIYREYQFRRVLDGEPVTEHPEHHLKEIITSISKRRNYTLIGSAFSIIPRIFFVGLFAFLMENAILGQPSLSALVDDEQKGKVAAFIIMFSFFSMAFLSSWCPSILSLQPRKISSRN